MDLASRLRRDLAGEVGGGGVVGDTPTMLTMVAVAMASVASRYSGDVEARVKTRVDRAQLRLGFFD